MNRSGNGNRLLSVALLVFTVILAACSGHGGSIVPSVHGNGVAARLRASGASGSFEQLILQSAPTQYFELEEAACCAASNIAESGVSGTYTSSLVTYSLTGPLQGETSTAIGLPGNTVTTATSMGVSLPNPATSGAFTVEDWVFPAFTSTFNAANAYYTIWGYNASHRLLINNQPTGQGQLLTQFGGINFRSTKALTPNAWNQVVFVYNGTSESFYVNGVLDSTQPVSGVSISSTYWLGQYDTTAYYKLDGRIGQHMVFPSALSASVIQSHFVAATSGVTPTPVPTSTPTSQPTESPQFVQQTNGSQSAPAAITVKFTNAPSFGDVLLVFFHNDGTSTNAPVTYTPPTGWTQVDVDTTQVANSYESFYHVAGSSESGSYVFTPSASGSESVWNALEFSNVNTTSPIDRHGFAFVPRRSTTFTTPSETPSEAGDLAVISMMPTRSRRSTWTNASGWTVDLGPAPPWESEVVQQTQTGTSAVSETSTLSAENFGYAAIVLLAPGTEKVDWPTWGMTPYRNSYNPVETRLTTSNVGSLHQIWSTTAGGVFTDEPVIATNVTGTSEGTADLLFVGDAHANLYAMDANTGKVLWSKALQTDYVNPNAPDTAGCEDQPGGLYGIGGSPTIDRSSSLVYAVDGNGNLYAFDLATGTQKVGPTPMWPFNGTENITNSYSALTEDANAGIVYVPGSAHCGDANYGGINSYSISTGNVSHWYTEGGPPTTYGGVWGPGGVAIDPRNATNSSMNNIYFGTAYGNIDVNQYPYSIVRLTDSLSLVAANNPVTQTCCPDLDFGDTPLVFTPSSSGCGATLVAAESKNGALYVYNADNINGGPLETIQIGTLSQGGVNLGTAAYDPTRNLVYINNASDSSNTTLSPAILHGLLAFTVTAACQLQLAWQETVGPNGTDDGPSEPPTVANGVVYYVDGVGSGCTSVGNPNCTGSSDFYAFNASTGAVLLHATLPGPLFTPPVVVNGRVYLTTWNGGGPGIVYCFSI